MSAPKLTDAQVRALGTFAGWRESGLNSAMDEVADLESFGLVEKNPFAWSGWIVTDAGRAALAAHEAR